MRRVRILLTFCMTVLQCKSENEPKSHQKILSSSVLDIVPIHVRSLKTLILMFFKRTKNLIITTITCFVYNGQGRMIEEYMSTDGAHKVDNKNPYAMFILLKALTKSGHFENLPTDFFDNRNLRIKHSNPQSGLAILMSQVFASLQIKKNPKICFLGDVDLSGNVIGTKTPYNILNFALEQGFEFIFAPKEYESLMPKEASGTIIKFYESVYKIFQDPCFKQAIIANPNARHKTYKCLGAYTSRKGKLYLSLIQGIITPGNGVVVITHSKSKQSTLDKILKSSITEVRNAYQKSPDILKRLDSSDICIKITNEHTNFYEKELLQKAIELLLHSIILQKDINSKSIVQLNHYLSKECCDQILSLGFESIVDPTKDLNNSLLEDILIDTETAGESY